MTEKVQIGDATLYLCDNSKILRETSEAAAIITDPPYHGVKRDDWDNRWATDKDFIDWVQSTAHRLKRCLASNGSIYWFCSPQMSGRVESALRTNFRILGNIVWNKGGSRKGAAGTGIDVTALRTFWTANTERIIFAEQYGSDEAANDASGYESSCIALKKRIFGDYLRSEMDRAKVSNKDIAVLFPSKTGGLTGCVSNWLTGANVPTPEQYEEIRNYLNRERDEYLRQEYEELRQEYEELRRPFNAESSDQWGDVWDFPIERGQLHPTQKPIRLMQQIVKISSKPGTVVFDPFMGSGTTGVACAELGRKFIGVEKNPKYFEIACGRISAAQSQGRLFA